MLPDFRVRQRDFLLEISRAMTAQLELSEVLRLVLNASVVMLSGQVGLIALRDPNGTYRVRATMGMETDLIPVLNKQLRELFKTIGRDPDADVLNDKLREMVVALDRRLRQFINLPLVIAGQPLGMLIVFRNYRGSVTDNDLQILESFADQAAIAVSNAQLYERIDHDRRRLAAILENSADGIMILDSDLRISSFNRALERMTGHSAHNAVGRPQDEVIVWKRLDNGDLKTALQDGWPFRISSDESVETLYVEGDLLRPDGLTLSIGITYAPLLTGDGQLSSIIANVRDITHFRKAQEMQNVFISTVSHELKTPVALIKGYAGTLRREDAQWDPEVLQNSLAVIEDEADRLTMLIEDLLEASKLQAQRMELDLSEVHLDELGAQSLQRFRTQTDLHQFTLNFPPAFPLVHGDGPRLRQVLDNLISNAIKYSPDGGTIEVGGEADQETVTVYVRDEGIGLSDVEQERVFDRFYRADDTLRRSTQGAGLGLYLAKTVISAHNGTLRVKSKPGQGSTFYFTIPQR
jgi:PAS domain S-box-containing protein